jgi:uncharacterized membrane protein
MLWIVVKNLLLATLAIVITNLIADALDFQTSGIGVAIVVSVWMLLKIRREEIERNKKQD